MIAAQSDIKLYLDAKRKFGNTETGLVLFNSLLLASAQPDAALNQANLDRLRATKECPICDLNGAAQGTVTTLRDANMRGANMRGAILLALQSLTR